MRSGIHAFRLAVDRIMRILEQFVAGTRGRGRGSTGRPDESGFSIRRGRPPRRVCIKASTRHVNITGDSRTAFASPEADNVNKGDHRDGVALTPGFVSGEGARIAANSTSHRGDYADLSALHHWTTITTRNGGYTR